MTIQKKALIWMQRPCKGIDFIKKKGRYSLNNDEKRKKIEEILEKIEKRDNSSQTWKSIIENNKDEFEKLKAQIKLKENELKELIIKKQVGEISKTIFEEELEKLQDELTKLEFKLFNLRLKK